jgi:hypothetical protein
MGDSMNASSTGDLLLEDSARASEQARELQEAAAALMSRTWADEQSLRQRALAVDSDLKRLESVSKKNRSVDPKHKEKVRMFIVGITDFLRRFKSTKYLWIGIGLWSSGSYELNPLCYVTICSHPA